MKEKLVTVGTLVCLFVLTCLLLVHALAIFPGVPAIRWFFVTTAVAVGRLDAPAWVQAVGSIVAIFAAIGIAMWQRHSDKKVARNAARATVMVVGAAIDSLVHTLIGTAQAMHHEFTHPCAATAPERAIFFQNLFAKAQMPSEEQMLLLAQAIPEAAATLANGVAYMRRVQLTLDFIANAQLMTTVAEPELVAHYVGSEPNLLFAMRCLKDARAALRPFSIKRL